MAPGRGCTIRRVRRSAIAPPRPARNSLRQSAPFWCSAAQYRGPRDFGVAPRVRHHLELDRALPPDVERSGGLVDLGERRQACLVAEMLDRKGRRRARELEVLLPGDARIDQIGIHIGAMEDVAGAIGVDDL